jgi:hypothetical protein
MQHEPARAHADRFDRESSYADPGLLGRTWVPVKKPQQECRVIVADQLAVGCSFHDPVVPGHSFLLPPAAWIVRHECLRFSDHPEPAQDFYRRTGLVRLRRW